MSGRPVGANHQEASVSVTISIEADITMQVSDLWPDGDAPNPVTAEAVRDLMESCGSKRRVLDEWCLTDEVDVQVLVHRPNPAWKQNAAIFGEVPPQWLNERVEAWPWRRKVS